jgi:uncharacterized protein YlxW (UPF0749 family)
MDATREDGKVKYVTPRWVQVWFLRRSRDNWKRKYQRLKADAKRLQNRVNDVTRSRDQWRARAEAVQPRNAAHAGASDAAGASDDAAAADADAARPEPRAALKKGGR